MLVVMALLLTSVGCSGLTGSSKIPLLTHPVKPDLAWEDYDNRACITIPEFGLLMNYIITEDTITKKYEAAIRINNR